MADNLNDLKYSLGTPSLMRGLEKGQECEVKFLTDPKPVETEHGSKFDIQVLLLSHPHPDYSSLDCSFCNGGWVKL